MSPSIPKSIFIAFIAACLSIVNSQPSAPQTLNNGITAEFTKLNAGQSQPYVFYPSLLSGGRLIFGLNSYSGDPDIYVSTTQDPGINNYLWKNEEEGGGVIEISNIEDRPYYITVIAGKGWNARGSITAHAYTNGETAMSNPVILQFGKPVMDHIRPGQYHYYTFNVASNYTYINALLTHRYGDADIFINSPSKTVFPSTSSFDWRAFAVSEVDVIRMEYAEQGLYRVALYVYSDEAEFMFGVNHGIVVNGQDESATHLTMSDGFAYPLDNRKGEYQWAQFDVAGPLKLSANYTLTITATIPANANGYSEDVDMYCSDGEQFPTREKYLQQPLLFWTSESELIDMISVPVREIIPGMVYCGLFAKTDVQFQLLASLKQDIFLSANVAQNVKLNIGDGARFQYEITARRDNGFMVMSMPHSGNSSDFSLYIGNANSNVPIDIDANSTYELVENQNDYPVHALWVSTNGCGTSSPCRYPIAVFADSRSTSLSVIATSPANHLLVRDGVSRVVSFTTNSFTYYNFGAIRGSVINFNITSTAGALPDLFVSGPSYAKQYPTYTQCDHMGLSGGFMFSATGTGNYWVSVFGSAGSRFTMIVTGITDLVSASSSTGGARSSSSSAAVSSSSSSARSSSSSSVSDSSSSSATPSVSSSSRSSSSSSSAAPALSSSSSRSSSSSSAVPAVSSSSVSSMSSSSARSSSSSSSGGAAASSTGGRSSSSSAAMFSSSSSAAPSIYSSLGNGIPMIMTASASSYQYYSFTFEASSWPTQVVISALAYAGNPDLYVTKTPTPVPSISNSLWRSTNTSELDQIVIDSTDRQACNPTTPGSCTYYIAVYAADPTTSTRYVISAHTGDVNLLLANGRPTERQLSVDQSEHYTFVNEYVSTGTIVFGVNALAGDPDIWVSSSTSCQRPSDSCYDAKSTRDGGDMVAFQRAGGSQYYVTIKNTGRTTARYVLIAYSYNPGTINANPVQLVRGLGLPGWSANQEIRHYYYNVTAVPSKLIFHAARHFGDPNLLVNGPSRNAWPTSTRDAEFTAFAAGDDILAIRAVAVGTYRVSVVAAGATQYTITAGEGGSIQTLADGQAYGGDLVLNEWDYVSFNVPRGSNLNGRVLTINTVIMGNDGTQDISTYCSDTIMRPNPLTANWSSDSEGDFDSVVLTQRSGDLHSGTYYCGIFGNTSAKYTVVARLAATLQLQAGIGQTLTQAALTSQYFTFSISSSTPTDFTITSTHDMGNAFLYISLTGEPDIDKPESYFQSSTSTTFSTQTLQVAGSTCQGSAGQTSCTYYVLVSAQSATSYTILAETPRSSTVLTAGVNVDGIVALNSYHYYTLSLNGANTIVITLSTFSGNADIFVSRTTPRPTAQNAEWSSANDGTALDVVVIPSTAAMSGQYYISVFGSYTAVYRLVYALGAGSATTPVRLDAGRSQVGYIETGNTYRYYHFTPPRAGWPYYIKLTVQPLLGDPDFFLRADGVYARNSASSIWSDTTSFFDPIDYYIWPNQTATPAQGVCNPVTNSTCFYTIAVLAYGDPAAFSLMITMSNANGSTTPTQLSNGVSVERKMIRNQVDYFYFVTPQLGWTINIAASPFTGNPDIYVSGTVEQPDVNTATWKGTTAGGDIISIANAQSARYFIAVQAQGFTGTDYTIMVNAYDPANTVGSPITLVNAQGVTDVLGVGTYRYYTYSMSSADTRLVVGLVPNSGLPRLQINSPSRPTFPYGDNGQYKLNSITGRDVISVANPAAGIWRMSVFSGATPINYQLIAIRGNSTIQLPSKRIMPGSLKRGESQLYWFDASLLYAPYTEKSLTFSLTAFDGSNPDLYCSDVTMTPSATDFKWKSTDASSDTLQLSGRDGGLKIGRYACAVIAVTDSTYHMQAVLAERVDIYQGVGLVGGGQAGEIMYYTFKDFSPSNATDILITVNILYGKARVYVTRSPSYDPDPENNWTWKSDQDIFDVQTVRIPKSDCAGATGQARCIYNIAVYTPVAGSFQILVSTALSTNTLVPGIQQSRSLEPGQYAYYKFDLPVDRANVTISITGTGDPDMFISRTNPHPDFTDNEWVEGQESGMGEVWYIDWTDPHFRPNKSMASTYYVSVLGFEASSYTILLTISDPSGNYTYSTALINGGQVFNEIQRGAIHRYTFTPPVSGWPYPVSFSLTPVTGDPDIWIRADGQFATSSSDATWYSSNGEGQADQIRVTAADSNACNPVSRPGCMYTVSIYGYSTARYYLTVSTGAVPMPLVSGQATAVRTLEAGKWEYFYIRNPTGVNHTVVLSLNAISGDPDIYVSNITWAPSQSNYTYRGIAISHDIIVIKPAPSLIYFIGIYASGRQAQYALTGTSYDPLKPENNVKQLQAGVTIQDGLPGDEWRYYLFRLNLLEVPRLSMILSAVYEDPDMYVNYWGNSNTGVWPTARNNNWTSAVVGSDVINIDNPQPGLYAIAVHAFGTSNSIYTLVMAPTGATQQLTFGSPLYGSLPQGALNFYRVEVFSVVANADLSFTLTSGNGNADLYVSDIRRNPQPGAGNFTWSSSSAGADSVILNNRDLPGSVHVGYYYIGVYAETATTYSIVASYDSRITLTDGQQQSVYLFGGSSRYYQITVPGGANTPTVTIQTTVFYGSPVLYVGVNTVPTPVDPDTYQGYSDTSPAWIVMDKTSCVNVATCTYLILVRSSDSESSVQFNLLATTNSRSVMLTRDVSVAGVTNGTEPRFYAFSLASNKANVTIRLTTISGNADLYCSIRFPLPSPSQNDWKSDALSGDDVIYFDWTDQVFVVLGTPMATMYYCSVISPVGSSQYRLMYTFVDSSGQNTSITRLSEGQPQAGSLPAGQFSYYSFTPSRQGYPYDLYFTVTGIEGNPDLYIRNDGQMPSLGFYQWRSALDSGSADQVVVRSTSNGACTLASVNAGRCVYTLAVFAADNRNTRFQISASTSEMGSIITLTSGIPVTGFVVPEFDQGFSFTVTTPGQTLTVILTALSGNPDFDWKMSTGTRWISTGKEFGTDVLTLQNAAVGKYSFNVYAEKQQDGARPRASFNMVATLGTIRLLPGLPQDDVLESHSSRRYSVSFYDADGLLPWTVELLSQGEQGASIYVTNDGREPSPSDYNWKSTPEMANAGFIVVDPTDGQYRPSAQYEILVVAPTLRSVYTIISTDGQSVVTLQDGRPYVQQSSVPQLQYRYYRVYADNTQRDLEISLTVPQGSVSAYISSSLTRPGPSSNEYTFSTGSNGGATYIISRNNLQPRWYYIAIRGDSSVNARYQIALTTSHLVLEVGSPMQGTCDGRVHYYRVNLGGVTDKTLADINMALTAANAPAQSYSGSMRLYITSSLTNGSTSASYPNSTFNTWAANANYKIGQSFVISKTDSRLLPCIRTGSCALYMALSCPTTALSVSYYFSASNGKAIMPVLDSESRSGFLKPGDSDHYVSFVGNARSLVIQVDSCAGNADLYVSDTVRQPSKTNNKYSSSKVPPIALDSVFVVNPLPNSMWYSTVYAAEGNEYRFYSVATNASSSASLMPVFGNGKELLIRRYGEGLAVVFPRVQLSNYYLRPTTPNTKYTVRYKLVAIDIDDENNMYSNCGADRMNQLGTILDLEIDESDSITTDLDNEPVPSSRYGAIVVKGSQLASFMVCRDETDLRTCTVDPKRRFKMNMIAQVLRSKGSVVSDSFWSPYNPLYGITLINYGITSGSMSDDTSSSSSSIDLTMLIAIGVPCVLLVLALGWYIMKRRCSSSATRPSWAADQYQTSSLNDQQYRDEWQAPASTQQRKPIFDSISSDTYTSSHDVNVPSETTRFGGFGSSSSNGRKSSGRSNSNSGEEWYRADRYAIPTVEIAETSHSGGYQTSASASGYQPPASGYQPPGSGNYYHQ